MASVVYIFNAASVPINVIVNNGTTQFSVPAASTTTWAPGVPTTNPSFTGSLPAQGQFGYGVNNCAITPSTGGGTATASVNVPQSINPSDAIQLYLFYQNTTAVSWVLLDNGRAVSGNLTFPS
jgi:hypothetical protein